MSHKLRYHIMSHELSCHSYVRTYVPIDFLAIEFLSCTHHSCASAESLFSTCNNIYVYVYGYMCICICIYVYVYTYMYICICIYVYVYMYICIYVDYICIYVYMYICICIYVYVYMSRSVYVIDPPLHIHIPVFYM